MSTPTTKRDWKKIVEDHNGTMFFIPSNLLEAAKDWQAKRTEFQKEVNRVAETEAGIGMMFQTLIHDIRKFYSKNGIENIWTCDIGFNTEALKDGEFILNITKGERQP